MAGSLSNSGADDAISAAMGRGVAAGNRYLALCSSAPSDSALGTELAAPGTSGYARGLVAFGAPVDDGTGKRVCANSAAVTIGPFGAAFADCTHVMVMDDATSTDPAHMKGWCALDTTKPAGNGDSIGIAIGALKFSVD